MNPSNFITKKFAMEIIIFSYICFLNLNIKVFTKKMNKTYDFKENFFVDYYPSIFETLYLGNRGKNIETPYNI